MTDLIPVQGAILDTSLDTTHPIGHHGLDRNAYGRLYAAQVAIVSAMPSTEIMMVRVLDQTVTPARLSGDDVLHGRNDLFQGVELVHAG